MKVTFTKGEDKQYSATAVRIDGVTVEVKGSDRKFAIPHDIAHLVVEEGLGLRRGFWGRIARGAVYPGMRVISGRQPIHAAGRTRVVMRADEQQGIEAEVLVGVLVKIMDAGLQRDWPAARALLCNEWRPSSPERSLPDAAEVVRVAEALREAERQWQALAVGQSVTFPWDLDRTGVRRRARTAARTARPRTVS
jgi:hypothetical protein